MESTIPKNALVALSDLNNNGLPFRIVAAEEARVSAFDRSFHFGDSLYEVTRSYDGVLFSLEEHMRRLVHSAELAMFEVMPDTQLISTMVRETCRAFFRQYGNRDVYVRVMVSRGVGEINIDRSISSAPCYFVFVKELESYPARMYADGVHYAIVERRRNLPSALDPAMKSGNYLNNVLALVEAKKMGASDAIMLNYQGFVTEGTTNNVHMVKNGEIWTAPLSIGILAGITRDWIFEVCEKEKVSIQEKLFTAQDLYAADEMFLSSATKEVMPITTLTGRPVGKGKPGPVTQKLHRAFKKLIEDYTKKHKGESLYV